MGHGNRVIVQDFSYNINITKFCKSVYIRAQIILPKIKTQCLQSELCRIYIMQTTLYPDLLQKNSSKIYKQ